MRMPNSFLSSCDFCRILIAFENSLDPDQDLQNVSRSRSKPFDTFSPFVFLIDLSEKSRLQQKLHEQKHSIQRFELWLKARIFY